MNASGFWFYALSLLGLAISSYVWYSQKFGKPVVCLTQDCDRVIRSPYSRLLGVHNSAIGFWVFLLIFFVRALGHFGFEAGPNLTSLMVRLVSLVGTLVSLYLTYIQLFVLKGLCNWCLASAGLIFSILLLSWLDP